MTVRFDSSILPKIRYTEQGFARVAARLTRVGVLEYDLGNGQKRRELRLPEEVFAPASLASLRGVPVTDLHPGMVSPKNVRSVRVGGPVTDAKQDGDFVAAELQFDDASSIAAIEAGTRREISCGYNCRVEPASGTWRGQGYDAIQRGIVYNHIAIGPAGWGRAGSDVALRLDSRDLGFAVLHADSNDDPEFAQGERERARRDAMFAERESRNAARSGVPVTTAPRAPVPRAAIAAAAQRGGSAARQEMIRARTSACKVTK